MEKGRAIVFGVTNSIDRDRSTLDNWLRPLRWKSAIRIPHSEIQNGGFTSSSSWTLILLIEAGRASATAGDEKLTFAGIVLVLAAA